ncbi:nitrogenase iron-molybdenum cofactor biosynthesis protein NifN [Telmatospirillum sp. J64-1]|uniref:nitrogenase iron-molybdenum cofactor biosynthesis protein NifN n=1 Tax=Telmatospirillum sp. J64-1 TaxID=2502183 RepID=UPI00115DB0A6|nr:nitrogenase iron-molybdenum cofactor biosynthesis protein NifN [Telmatospirillum sp. J64-1]
MAEIVTSHKACSVNPLKMSAPLGGAMAFMGLDGCMPMLHGSQGCTAFALVLLVRHFREAIPFQTTAMNEVTTILGGLDNIEQAILNVASRARPKVIGICSTGLVETRGEDVTGDLKLVRQRHPELDNVALVYASTPDFAGGFQDGWGKAVTAMVETLAEPSNVRDRRLVNILAGSHLTPADLEEIRELVEAFGLHPVILPDLSGSLDGHVPETYVGTTFGGTTLEDIAVMGRAAVTLAIGEHMRPAALALEARTGVPFHLFERLTGLGAVDDFVSCLMEVSGTEVPARIRRQRSQLVDAMLDGHFHFGGRKVALAAEPDLLFALSSWLGEMGAEIVTAIAPQTSPILPKLPVGEVVIGDLGDLEDRAAGCDLLVTHSHGRQASDRLGIPLMRVGFPMFDRLGAAHRLSVGYRGTRDLIFEAANLFIAHTHEHGPDDWPLPQEGEAHAAVTAH